MVTRTLRDRVTVRAAGATFADGYPWNLALLELAGVLDPERRIKVDLVRQPENVADVNAVSLEIEGLGHVGHLPRWCAAQIAPELDAGVGWLAWVSSVEVHPNNPSKPGLRVTMRRLPDVNGEHPR